MEGRFSTFQESGYQILILRDNGKVVSDGDGEEMPKLKDASDSNGVEYLVVGEELLVIHALNTKIKVDDLEQKRENIVHMS